MTLEAGQRLGSFEVLEPLGAGGMGEVYRAQDTRLDRTVALKVLPSELSANPALRERFEREARAISNLAHPHICTLHDVGREGDVDFLVMEYLEGETLADRLQKGPLPVITSQRTTQAVNSPGRESKEVMEARAEAQYRVIANSETNMQLRLPNARHEVYKDQPQVIVDAFVMLLNLGTDAELQEAPTVVVAGREARSEEGRRCSDPRARELGDCLRERRR